MAEYIVMPKLGFDMREGVLVRWLKEIGESVSKGDIVAEIESDKATLELESQVSGTLLKRMGEAGDVIAVGANLAIVGAEGEDVASLNGDAPAKKEAPAEVKPEEKTEEKTEPKAEPKAEPAAAASSSAAVSNEFPGGVKATPVARRVAKEQKVDLAQVQPTGPDGRIRKADVEAFLQAKPAEKATEEKAPVAAAPKTAPAPTPVTAGEGDTEVPATRLRQAIARRMTESKTTVPHFYVTNEINMEAALALRKQINAMLPDEEKVTVNDLIVKAVALALRDFPNLNASFAGDKFIHHGRINIGVAVAVEGGLLTVVNKDTDKTSVSQIAAANKAMIARARSGKISPNDVEGATFTVSNLGAFDVENFIAIISPPDAAILAVGSARQVPIVKDGQLAIGTMMKATISADHRVTDGAEAAQYMQKLKSLLENPMRLLL
ncbi:MAG: 2-oxo acid dehydrogenase subunit E2 [Chloroflexi bacterium]|nr:2-oxo acid dehydrogenase subunit E2 [Chloroflexota bacterium]